MMHQLTPSQREQHEAHKARRSRFEERARANISAQLKRIQEERTAEERQRHAEEREARERAEAIERQKNFYRDAWRKIEGAPGRIDEAQRICAKYYGVKVQDLLSARRTANVIMPRHVAMWLAKDQTRRSLPEIGRRFGGRDHSTVLFAVRKIDRLSQIDPKIAQDIDNLRKLMGPQDE